MELVDSHCHLQFDNYKNRENEIIAAASKNGVKKLICVGTTLHDSKFAVELSQKNKGVWAATGAHPHEATKFLTDPNSPKKLRKLASLPRVVAIGETGLDYYRQTLTKEDQRAALRTQIEVGLELNLPFIFHIREAWEDFWPIFDSYKNLSGVVHSFSTHSGHLEEILSRNLYIGLNGIMTFTKDDNQLEAAKAVPLDRLLLETDAPFLTPTPYRGVLCEPKHILTIAEFLAKLREEDFHDLAAATTANAVKLFGLEIKK